MNKFMHQNKRYILPLMLSAMVIGASSCSSNPSLDSVEKAPSNESPVASSPSFTAPSSEIPTPILKLQLHHHPRLHPLRHLEQEHPNHPKPPIKTKQGI